MAALCSAAALQAQDYYVVTGDNVNVRSQPVTGKVVGKVSSVNSFTGWDAGNGWVNFRITSVSGAISDKFVRKVALRDFPVRCWGNIWGKRHRLYHIAWVRFPHGKGMWCCRLPITPNPMEGTVRGDT